MSYDLSKLLVEMRKRPDLFEFSNKEDQKVKSIILRMKGRSLARLSINDIFEIAKVKSPRSAGNILNNDPCVVAEILRAVKNSSSDETRVRLLSSLDGVGIPTASAILAWTNEKRYGVIDVRSWNTLNSDVYRCIAFPYIGYFSPKEFVLYCTILRDAAHQLKKTPQLIDLWLYRFDRDVLKNKLPLSFTKNVRALASEVAA
jgi:hypothetical protein